MRPQLRALAILATFLVAQTTLASPVPHYEGDGDIEEYRCRRGELYFFYSTYDDDTDFGSQSLMM